MGSARVGSNPADDDFFLLVSFTFGNGPSFAQIQSLLKSIIFKMALVLTDLSATGFHWNLLYFTIYYYYEGHVKCVIKRKDLLVGIYRLA